MATTPHLHLPATRPSPADVRLGEDRRSHTRMDVFAWCTLGVALISFGFAAAGGSLAGVAVGVLALALAAVGQMLSQTTAQRWVFVPAWVMAALSVGLNGFYVWSP